MSWRHPGLYTDAEDLVQVLCEVTEPSLSEFPRACELPVSSGDHAVGQRFVSVGFVLPIPDEHQNLWSVAGWNMAQDCWQGAHCFEVIGWQPLADVKGPWA